MTSQYQLEQVYNYTRIGNTKGTIRRIKGK